MNRRCHRWSGPGPYCTRASSRKRCMKRGVPFAWNHCVNCGLQAAYFIPSVRMYLIPVLWHLGLESWQWVPTWSTWRPECPATQAMDWRLKDLILPESRRRFARGSWGRH